MRNVYIAIKYGLSRRSIEKYTIKIIIALFLLFCKILHANSHASLSMPILLLVFTVTERHLSSYSTIYRIHPDPLRWQSAGRCKNRPHGLAASNIGNAFHVKRLGKYGNVPSQITKFCARNCSHIFAILGVSLALIDNITLY